MHRWVDGWAGRLGAPQHSVCTCAAPLCIAAGAVAAGGLFGSRPAASLMGLPLSFPHRLQCSAGHPH